jgi:type II secretory pathway pseudopilin PulG
VEVLVSLAVIALFASGIAALAIAIVSGNEKAKSMDVAVYLAHDRLETIRNTPYATITSGTFTDEGYGAVQAGSPLRPYPAFQRSVTIQDNTPTQGMKRVVVTVSWSGGSVREEVLVGQ